MKNAKTFKTPALNLTRGKTTGWSRREETEQRERENVKKTKETKGYLDRPEAENER